MIKATSCQPPDYSLPLPSYAEAFSKKNFPWSTKPLISNAIPFKVRRRLTVLLSHNKKSPAAFISKRDRTISLA